MLKRRKNKGSKHPSIVLIAPVQKGFPITDFDVSEVENKTYLFSGNAFGCVATYRVPALDEHQLREESKEDLPYLCYQLQKYADAAVRHIWIQKDADTGVKRVYVLIGFSLVCCWQLKDIFEAKPSSRKDNQYAPDQQPIPQIFFKNKQTEIFSIRHKHHLSLFGIKSDTVHHVNLQRKQAKQTKMSSGFSLPDKTEVLSFDGRSYCFLVLNHETGVRDLVCKDAQSFEDIGTLNFPKASTNYCCFQHVGNVVAYCSNNNVVKLYDLKQQKLLYRLKGHSGYILALHFDGEVVATLGSDHKLKLWQDGECIQKLKKIPGQFNPGYLYKVLYRGDSIYYTADNGIYCAYLTKNSK